MKIPFLFMRTVLIFWGIESGSLLLAIPMALILEGSSLIKEKWTLSDKDFIRISDLTSIVFLTAIALILQNYEPRSFFRIATIWLPVILFPLIMAQIYSTHDKIIIGTAIGSKKKIPYRHDPLDFTIFYSLTCLFSIAAANSRSVYFYPGFSILLAWLVIQNKGKQHSRFTLLCCISLIVLFGYLGSIGIQKSHHYATKLGGKIWFNYYKSRFIDPFKSYISYGSIGKLKLSGEILLRVKSDKDKQPLLLHEASYILYNQNGWHNNSSFTETPTASLYTWQIAPEPQHPDNHINITIEQNLPKEKGVIVKPYGSFLLHSPNIFKLQNNVEGTLNTSDCALIVENGFTFLNQYFSPSDLPNKKHLHIPKVENAALDIIKENHLTGLVDNKQKIAAIHLFFEKDFSYTLDLQDSGKEISLLSNFLINTKKGHCELFASATTLLLRKVGIPSRYVTGFVVEEYSTLEKAYIVRERHAHAWSEAFIDNKWHIIDTTPSNWYAHDKSQAPFLEPLKDLISYLKQKYRKFQIQSEGKYNTSLSLLIVALSSILIYRIYRRLQMKRNLTVNSSKKKFIAPDSPFNSLVIILEDLGEKRTNSETFQSWLNRIHHQTPVPKESILELYRYHQSLRFDNDHFSSTDLKKLEDGVEDILNQIEQIKFHQSTQLRDNNKNLKPL